MDFTDRVAIVTGGASGMGAATVRRLAAGGARVVIVDRNEALAAEVTASLIAASVAAPSCAAGASGDGASGAGAGASVSEGSTGAVRAVAEAGDVSDSAFCDGVVWRAMERWGRVDVLVNAAGVIARAGGLETTDDQWHRVMNVNVSGTFFMCRAALAVMKPAGRGAIVNFGSIWGDLGSAGVAAYCASKGAVHNLTRALALDHAGDGVRVNAVCPGEVNTPMLSSERSEPVTQDTLDRIAASVPMGRLADPDEIARVVCFLASDEASYMTGALVSVDAGYGAR